MFFRPRRFFRFILVAILLMGMFGLFSSAAYRSGWSEGFVSGQTADGPTAESAPGGPFNQGFGSRGPGFFSFFWWGLAAFFKFWLFLFFVGLIFKFLFGGRRGHHRHGRPFGHRKGHWGGGHWGGRHGHHHEGRHKGKGRHEKGRHYKGQRPPWYDDSSGEPVMKA